MIRIWLAAFCLITWLSAIAFAQFNGFSGIFALNSMTFGVMPKLTPAGGSGYAIGDLVTLDCPGSVYFPVTHPIITITAVVSGAPTAVLVGNPGIATQIPSSGLAGTPNGICTFVQISTTGAGSGATFAGSFGFISANTASVTASMSNCVGDGVTDDTACTQANINSASALGVPLTFSAGPGHLYNISATGLAITSPIDIEGAFRYGFWTTTPNNADFCPWGLYSTANSIIINASAITGTIRNLCIQAGAGTGNAGTNSSATAGTSIQLAPPSLTTYQTGWHIEGNTILNSFDGITINGFGYSGVCCGAGTTADGVTVWRNTIINSADAGISVGKNTAGSATPGISIIDNAIGCINAVSKANGIGLVEYDGGIWYDGTQNGPEGCNIGIAIIPGTVSGHSQYAQIDAKGVAGDQSKTHDLLIQPTTSLGIVAFSEFDNIWASGTQATDNEILISDANGGVIENLTFLGGTAHSSIGQTLPVLDVEGTNASGQLYNIIFNSISIDCWLTSTSCTLGVKINSGTGGQPAYINFISNRIGVSQNTGVFTTDLSLNTNPGGAFINVNDNILEGTTGISLATPSSGSASALNIIGNNLYNTTTPISYTPNTIDVVNIANNIGVDNNCPSVTVTSNAITLPNANSCFIITTSGTPSVNSIGPVWQGRSIQLQSAQSGGFTLATGGSTFPICKSATVAQYQVLSLSWRASATCWNTSL